METPVIIAIVGAGVAILTSLITLATVVYLAGVKVSAIQVKVDTLWAFQIRRAMGEVVHTGVGKMNSPLTFNEEVEKYLAYLNPLKPKLIEFWDAKAKTLPATDALLELERTFGDVLLTDVCIPGGLSHGACLLLAYSVAAQTRTLTFEIGN